MERKMERRRRGRRGGVREAEELARLEEREKLILLVGHARTRSATPAQAGNRISKRLPRGRRQ